MKNTIRYTYWIGLIILIIMMVIPSCTKLEDESFNDIFAEDYVYSEDDIRVIINSAYGDWRKILLYWNGLWRTQEVGADEIVIPARPNGWVDAGEFRRMHEHTWVDTDPQVINNWQRTYTGIENCNRVLDDLEADKYSMEEELKNSSIAQLKVLRASYYYILCDIYGNVPIVEHSAEYLPEGYLPEQSTRKEVYDFIVKEITDNLPFLSRKRDNTTYGKWNVWAARTLLAKMYLNAEVFSGTPQWEKCIEQCDSVIDNDAGYGFEADQKSVFVTENENSIEILYGLPIEPTLMNTNPGSPDWNAFDHHMQTLQPVQQAQFDINYSPWGGMCAIPQFINTFDEEDSRFTRNFMTGQQFSSSGEPLLAGMGVYVNDPLIFVNEVPGVDSSQAIHGYRFTKFEIKVGTTNCLENDYPLFRYTDILMMKAECLLRLGQADDAAEIVTQVRQRAFRSNPAKATVTGAELLSGSVYDYGRRDHKVTTSEGGDDIQYGRFLDELGWEFNQEGRRRQDMIRFGVFTTKSWLSHSPNGDHRILYPIPAIELNKNPNLSQNDGY